MAAKRNRDLVYSSGVGRICPLCGHAAEKCVCRSSPRVSRGDGIVRVRREIKGRRGKTVTTISGVPLAEDELRELAGDLKRQLGTGGATKNGVIEIQGDHRDALIESLRAKGYSVKPAGG